MSRLVPLLTLVATVAAMWHSGPQQAWACSCAFPDGDESLVRHLIASGEPIIIGRVESIERGPKNGFISARVSVEQIYTGDPPRNIVVHTTTDTGSCGYPDIQAEPRTHLFMLVRESVSHYRAYSCGAFWVTMVNGRPEHPSYSDFLAMLERVVPVTRVPAPERHGFGDDTPQDDGPPGWIAPAFIVLASAALVGIVVWTVATGPRRRR